MGDQLQVRSAFTTNRKPYDSWSILQGMRIPTSASQIRETTCLDVVSKVLCDQPRQEIIWRRYPRKPGEDSSSRTDLVYLKSLRLSKTKRKDSVARNISNTREAAKRMTA